MLRKVELVVRFVLVMARLAPLAWAGAKAGVESGRVGK